MDEMRRDSPARIQIDGLPAFFFRGDLSFPGFSYTSMYVREEKGTLDRGNPLRTYAKRWNCEIKTYVKEITRFDVCVFVVVHPKCAYFALCVST